MPGGFGTLDEVFETLNLMQTGKIDSFPVVCMASDFWNDLDEFLNRSLVREKTIAPDDLDLLYYTDVAEDALKYITQHPRGCSNYSG
jgi:predicted Rossmann-fold nucleotide-binding protein